MQFIRNYAIAILFSVLSIQSFSQGEVDSTQVDTIVSTEVVVDSTATIADSTEVVSVDAVSVTTSADSLAVVPSIDDKIEAFMAPITEEITSVIFFEVDFFGFTLPFVLIWLCLGALIFTFYFGFVNITGFKHAIEVVRGKFDDPNKKEAGEVSHFQALTAALSGTVGVGNIAGVAIAVSG